MQILDLRERVQRSEDLELPFTGKAEDVRFAEVFVGAHSLPHKGSPIESSSAGRYADPGQGLEWQLPRRPIRGRLSDDSLRLRHSVAS